MFLLVRRNSFISYDCGVITEYDIEQLNDELFLNLLTICQITFKKCSRNINLNITEAELKYKIEFDRFVEEGVLNHFTLFFKSKKDKEFKRITKAINAFIYKENNMPENNADIKNKNKGTKGTNKTYDKNQGNRGKQLNTNQKEKK